MDKTSVKLQIKVYLEHYSEPLSLQRLFSNTKAGKNIAQQIIRRVFPGNAL